MNSFEVDWTLNDVAGVIGAPPPRMVVPYPLDHGVALAVADSDREARHAEPGHRAWDLRFEFGDQLVDNARHGIGA